MSKHKWTNKQKLGVVMGRIRDFLTNTSLNMRQNIVDNVKPGKRLGIFNLFLFRKVSPALVGVGFQFHLLEQWLRRG